MASKRDAGSVAGASDEFAAKVAKINPKAEVLQSRAATMLFTIIATKTPHRLAMSTPLTA
jgi:hypothetical protein